jgi:hypothetical protein
MGYPRPLIYPLRGFNTTGKQRAVSAAKSAFTKVDSKAANDLYTAQAWSNVKGFSNHDL